MKQFTLKSHVKRVTEVNIRWLTFQIQGMAYPSMCSRW